MATDKTDLSEDNIIPVTLEHLTEDQKADMAKLKEQVEDMYLKSFCLTRKGTIIQKRRITLPGIAEEGNTSGTGEDGSKTIVKEEDKKGKPTFQDQLDTTIHHTLINQSSVLVNTMTDVMRSMMDGTLTSDKARGLIYFPEHKFPPYRTLKTEPSSSKQPMTNDPSASAQLVTSVLMVLTKQPGGTPHHMTEEQLAQLLKIKQQPSISYQPTIDQGLQAHQVPLLQPISAPFPRIPTPPLAAAPVLAKMPHQYQQYSPRQPLVPNYRYQPIVHH